jgi:hypothetical protein
MSDTSKTAGPAGGREREGDEARISSLFASMVLNQTQMALMLLGRVPHPQSGQSIRDLEGARLLIDQLEMLEVKTKGNLDAQETRMLREGLMALRMTYVEAADEGKSGNGMAEAARADAKAEVGTERPASGEGGGGAAEVPEEELRKKFTKKY